jgi:hypothetical protein
MPMTTRKTATVMLTAVPETLKSEAMSGVEGKKDAEEKAIG